MVLRNEEIALAECLKDIKDFVQEIIIVDQSSTDGTKKVAEQFTQKIFIRPLSGFTDTDRQFSIDQATCPWVLVLDPDERLDLNLKSNLNRLIDSGFEAFWFPRKDFIDGRYYDQGGEDLRLRFFKKEAVIWPQIAHESPKLNTRKVGKANDGFILHARSLERIQEVHEDRKLFVNECVKIKQNEFVEKVENWLSQEDNLIDSISCDNTNPVISHKSRYFDLASHIKNLESHNPQMTDNEAMYRFLYELSLS